MYEKIGHLVDALTAIERTDGRSLPLLSHASRRRQPHASNRTWTDSLQNVQALRDEKRSDRC
jgi:hypothetical protein